ncbi:MAG: TolC family protein [Saprospiraceae bacterium]|nr:TolC family protein [Saprospiraceae bacterium]MDG2418955.1 TolC family protein [Saprospiraceae bacterium]
MQKITLIIFSVLVFGNVLIAQPTWSLEKCIQHVQESNTSTVRHANLEVEKNKIILEKTEAERQPDLGFSTNFGLNLGRTIDPSTNAFGNSSTLYNSFQLESNYTLYDGNQAKKRMKKSVLAVRSAQYDADQLTKDLSLNVLRTYLTILMAEEQLSNAKKNLSQTESWMRQTKNLVNAGLQSNVDLRNVEIQKARDEQKIIDRQNYLDRSYVSLKNILELDPSQSLKIAKPLKIVQPDESINKLSFKTIYSGALKTQPSIEGGELELKSLKLDKQIALAEKKPSVSLFGGIWANYSSRNMEADDSNSFMDTVTSNFITLIPGPDNYITASEIITSGVETKNKKYFSQLGENLGYGVGLNIYLPILDKKASKLNSQIAQVNYRQQQEENIQFKQQLRIEIQNAILDVQAAAKKLEAAEKTLSLLEASIVSMKNRLSLGNINAFEYKTILNERDSAEIELVLAKYEFILKKMVVEFYEGKKLRL